MGQIGKQTWWYRVESNTLTREDVELRFFERLLQESNLGSIEYTAIVKDLKLQHQHNYGERAEHATPGTLSTIVDHTSSSRMNHQAFFTREVQPHKHLKDASTRASTSGSNQRKSTCENTHAELAVASQPSLKRVRRSASAATNTRQSRIIQANGEGVVQLPVEVVFWLCRGCNRKGASEASDLDAKTKQEGDQQALDMHLGALLLDYRLISQRKTHKRHKRTEMQRRLLSTYEVEPEK
ncbi:hypothetical protein Tco_1246827 [Tanacetum coccineum]